MTAMATRDESEIQVDITLYGATGFVGKHVARYLLAASKENKQPLRLTLAGRNLERLQARKEYLANQVYDSTVDVFVADSNDLAALTKMAEQSRVVLNCAGPFIQYGTNVVAACASVGADYVDITGEITWAGQMRTKFASQAKQSGARIISLCGFDSIPSDMAIYAAVQALRQARGNDAVEIQEGCTWHSGLGMANGGTHHSALEFPLDIDHCLRKKQGDKTVFRRVPFLVDDPLVLTNPTLVRYNPDYEDYKNRMAAAEWKNQLPSCDSEFRSGVSLPFFMAPVNAKVLAASAVALQYGSNFVYRERFLPMGFKWTRTFGIISVIPALMFQATLLLTMSVFMLPVIGKKLADWILPPGSGVPDSFLDSCYAQVYAEVTAESQDDENTVDRATSFISFQGDPGNLVTAQCVGEAALCLVHNRDELPTRSDDGFGTSAELLGNVLLKRLEASKVRPVVMNTTVHKNAPKRETKVYM